MEQSQATQTPKTDSENNSEPQTVDSSMIPAGKRSRMLLLGIAMAGVLLLIVLLVLVGVVANSATDSQKSADDGEEEMLEEDESGDLSGEELGIRNVSIEDGDVVTDGMVVTGEVAGWFFEGSFSVHVLTSDGSELGVANATPAGGADWMTEGFVPFEVTLDFLRGTETEGTIEFRASNPSDDPELDRSFVVMVNLADPEGADESTASVSNLSANQRISSPFTLRGMAEGWFFEGSFTVKVFDTIGGTQIGTGFAMVPPGAGSWMDPGSLPFEAQVYFVSNELSEGVLVLEKANPSGLPEHDESITIPVRFIPEDIHVDNIVPYQEINRFDTVTGEAVGPWYFEGSFPLELTRTDGTVVNTVPVAASGDTYTEDWVAFSYGMAFSLGEGQSGFLVFNKSNASGMPELDDEFVIPVRY